MNDELEKCTRLTFSSCAIRDVAPLGGGGEVEDPVLLAWSGLSSK